MKRPPQWNQIVCLRNRCFRRTDLIPWPGPQAMFSIHKLELPGPMEIQSSPVPIWEFKIVTPDDDCTWIPSVLGLFPGAEIFTPFRWSRKRAINLKRNGIALACLPPKTHTPNQEPSRRHINGGRSSGGTGRRPCRQKRLGGVSLAIGFCSIALNAVLSIGCKCTCYVHRDEDK
nr:Os01g0623750 [Ipomoea batatas]